MHIQGEVGGGNFSKLLGEGEGGKGELEIKRHPEVSHPSLFK